METLKLPSCDNVKHNKYRVRVIVSLAFYSPNAFQPYRRSNVAFIISIQYYILDSSSFIRYCSIPTYIHRNIPLHIIFKILFSDSNKSEQTKTGKNRKHIRFSCSIPSCRSEIALLILGLETYVKIIEKRFGKIY